MGNCAFVDASCADVGTRVQEVLEFQRERAELQDNLARLDERFGLNHQRLKELEVCACACCCVVIVVACCVHTCGVRVCVHQRCPLLRTPFGPTGIGCCVPRANMQRRVDPCDTR